MILSSGKRNPEVYYESHTTNKHHVRRRAKARRGVVAAGAQTTADTDSSYAGVSQISSSVSPLRSHSSYSQWDDPVQAVIFCCELVHRVQATRVKWRTILSTAYAGGVESPQHTFDSCSSCGIGISPKVPYFCACGSSGWTNVMVRPWKGGNYLKSRSLALFRIVWMALRIRDNHEMGRARALPFRCHRDSGK